MKVKDLKEWVLTLPEEFDNFSMVFREISNINNMTMFLDKPIVSVGIDEDNGELFVLDSISREHELKFLEDETN